MYWSLKFQGLRTVGSAFQAEGAEDMKTILPGQTRVYVENREETHVW